MMKKPAFRSLLVGLLLIALAGSFWYSPAWLQLCYGLALFLFGMQCIEEGLHNAAGGTLERLMASSTATPARGLMFGMGATFVLQSSTLVSLLTIAFLSTGLIGLAGGIAVILGTNLGATGGIWLLALAGQSRQRENQRGMGGLQHHREQKADAAENRHFHRPARADAGKIQIAAHALKAVFNCINADKNQRNAHQHAPKCGKPSF